MKTEKMYRLRVVLDAEEDVIRDIEINEAATLRNLHDSILEAFELEPGEMASFYGSNENWDQGEEINLVDFGGTAGTARLMQDVTVDDYFYKKGSRMIYVYDLLNLWTFFLEMVDTLKVPANTSTKIVKVTGERPKNPPPKTMEGVGLHDEDEDEYNTENDLYFDESEWDDFEY